MRVLIGAVYLHFIPQHEGQRLVEYQLTLFFFHEFQVFFLGGRRLLTGEQAV